MAADEFQIPCRKITEERDTCLNSFWIQTNVPYSGEKISEKTFISKKKKQAPGFKAGMDSLALPFCANAVGFMIRTARIYKAAHIWALTGKNIHQLLVFWLYSKKSQTMRSLFLDWFHWCFVLDIRKYLSHKALPFKDLLILDNVPSHPEPHEVRTTGAGVVYLLPNTVSQIQIPDQGSYGL